MDIFAIDSTLLITAILKANRSYSSLEKLRELARDKKLGLILEDGLLFRHGLLIVPDTDDNLRTQFIQKAYTPISSAHPSPGKTIKLLRTRYFWRTMGSDITQYIANCHECRRAHRPRDKIPGFLHSLLIPNYRW